MKATVPAIRRALTKTGAGYLWMLPALIFLSLMIGYPLLFNIVLSVQDVTTTTLLDPVKDFIGLRNYISVVNDPVFFQVVRNSFLFTMGCVFFQFTIGLALALLFNMRFPFAAQFRGTLLVSLMVPVVIVSIVFRWLLSGDFGVINEILIQVGLLRSAVAWLAQTETALAGVMLANIWIGIPFNMMLLAPGIAAVNPSLYEAAFIDGAGSLARFRCITLPMIRPAILVTLVLGFIYTFRIFGLIFAMTGGGPVNATNVLPVHAYRLSFSFFNFGQGAAATFILVLILVGAIAVYLRLVGREEVME